MVQIAVTGQAVVILFYFFAVKSFEKRMSKYAACFSIRATQPPVLNEVGLEQVHIIRIAKIATYCDGCPLRICSTISRICVFPDFLTNLGGLVNPFFYDMVTEIVRIASA